MSYIESISTACGKNLSYNEIYNKNGIINADTIYGFKKNCNAYLSQGASDKARLASMLIDGVKKKDSKLASS